MSKCTRVRKTIRIETTNVRWRYINSVLENSIRQFGDIKVKALYTLWYLNVRTTLVAVKQIKSSERNSRCETVGSDLNKTTAFLCMSCKINLLTFFIYLGKIIR